jgi:flagellin
VLNGTADTTFQVGAGTATTDSIKVAASSAFSACPAACRRRGAATAAIASIDTQLDNLNTARANWGAVQNRFSSVVSTLSVASENAQASRGRIMDADFAKETANMTRAQILQQAGTAMVSQANSMPNNVLSLLQ